MKIGIDGVVLNQDYESGQKRYLDNLLANLAKIDRKNEYFIFAKTDAHIPNASNFKLIKLPSWLPILKRQIVVPLLAYINQIDIFHFPDTWGSAIPPARETILTFHDMAPKFSYPKWYESPRFFLMRTINYLTRINTMRYSSRIIVATQAIKNEYENQYGKDKRLKVILEGIHSDFKKIRVKNGNFFLAFADFSPRKNIDGVLNGYRIFLSNKGAAKKTRLKIIVSTSYPKSTIHNLCKNYKVDKYVDIAIGISNKNLVKFYNQAIALIYPSFYEGFGFPVLEAFACGCPVITTNYGATKEVAGRSALLVDPRDPKKIAQSMYQILKSKKIASTLIKRGFKRVKNFNWEKTARETLELYRSVY